MYNNQCTFLGRRRCASMESGKIEALRRSKTKKLLNTKPINLPPDKIIPNSEKLEPNSVSHVYPNQATISMEIRHQGPTELEMAVRYHQGSRQGHPVYSFNNQNQFYAPQNCLPPILPGFHGSPGFRSGSFIEPQNLENSQPRSAVISHEITLNGYRSPQEASCQEAIGRPRSYALGNFNRPNLNQLLQNQNYGNNQNQNIGQRFNHHFEGFQEGYNPNFVEYQNAPSYSTQNYMSQIPRSGNDVSAIQVADDSVQINSNILDCNIADIIKKELEIDGTLDFV